MDETGEERDERVTSAVLPAPVGNAAEGRERLEVQAGKQCWHHFSAALQAVLTQCTHAGRVQYFSTNEKAGTYMNKAS
jgi:hypothetical protein